MSGVGFRAYGLGFRVPGLGFRVQGSGFRVQGAGFGFGRERQEGSRGHRRFGLAQAGLLFLWGFLAHKEEPTPLGPP